MVKVLALEQRLGGSGGFELARALVLPPEQVLELALVLVALGQRAAGRAPPQGRPEPYRRRALLLERGNELSPPH